MKLIRFFLFIGIFCSCKGQPEKTSGVPAGQQKLRTSIDIEPLIKEVDSLDILFYDDPYGDSLRYSRFYSYAFLNDKSSLATVLEQMNQPVIFKSELDSCRSEGKFYMFRKQEPVKTIYFSLRSPSCNHLYFIKDGNYFYLKPVKEFTDLLAEVKQKAMKTDQ